MGRRFLGGAFLLILGALALGNLGRTPGPRLTWMEAQAQARSYLTPEFKSACQTKLTESISKLLPVPQGVFVTSDTVTRLTFAIIDAFDPRTSRTSTKSDRLAYYDSISDSGLGSVTYLCEQAPSGLATSLKWKKSVDTGMGYKTLKGEFKTP